MILGTRYKDKQNVISTAWNMEGREVKVCQWLKKKSLVDTQKIKRKKNIKIYHYKKSTKNKRREEEGKKDQRCYKAFRKQLTMKTVSF